VKHTSSIAKQPSVILIPFATVVEPVLLTLKRSGSGEAYRASGGKLQVSRCCGQRPPYEIADIELVVESPIYEPCVIANSNIIIARRDVFDIVFP
jgi:hypothetical protein